MRIHSEITFISSGAARAIIHFRFGSGINNTGLLLKLITTDELLCELLLEEDEKPPRDELENRLKERELLDELGLDDVFRSPLNRILSNCTISTGSPSPIWKTSVTICSASGTSNCIT
ncbi:MAG: hypothetical protein IID32_10715, partial [Planctomycetes bacterium]|nr:hypothetical protein [Planctomycetota bacterium]